MFMPKQHRNQIYEYLFKEGVMVAKKDFNAPKHPELQTIPNLHVIKTMQSLLSKGLVTEQFAWRHFYWLVPNNRQFDNNIWMYVQYLNLKSKSTGTWPMMASSTCAPTCTCRPRLCRRRWSVPPARRPHVRVRPLPRAPETHLRLARTDRRTVAIREQLVARTRRVMSVPELAMLNS